VPIGRLARGAIVGRTRGGDVNPALGGRIESTVQHEPEERVRERRTIASPRSLGRACRQRSGRKRDEASDDYAVDDVDTNRDQWCRAAIVQRQEAGWL
jgi:hypothetical protein